VHIHHIYLSLDSYEQGQVPHVAALTLDLTVLRCSKFFIQFNTLLLQFFHFFAQLKASKIMNKMRMLFLPMLRSCRIETLLPQVSAMVSVALLMLKDFQNSFTVVCFRHQLLE
jgi:hypothetical protein